MLLLCSIPTFVGLYIEVDFYLVYYGGKEFTSTRNH